MGCGEFVVKYILFFANLIFALGGLALLGIGIAIELQITALTDHLDGNYQFAPISSMVIGGIVFIIAFFGCCGAIRESNCMLITYAVFMIGLMILKVALGVLIFTNLEDFTKQVIGHLNDLFSKDQTTFHEIEKTFNCCGTTGPQSYSPLSWTPLLPLPASCCKSSPCTMDNAYSGCNDTIQDFFNTSGLLIGVFAIVIAAIELVAVTFALCLANHVRNKERRARY